MTALVSRYLPGLDRALGAAAPLVTGQVTGVVGLTVTVRGLHAAVGHLVRVCAPDGDIAAEVVAVTLEEMGVLRDDSPTNWYDPGRFWSGDTLSLRPGWAYGVEVGVEVARGPDRDSR